jgi:hypothetical protein
MRQVCLVGRRLVVTGRRVRRREHEPPRTREPGSVENAQRLADIHVERSERVGHGVGDPGSRGEVDDGIGTLDRCGHGLPIGERRPDQLVWHAVEIGETADRKIVEDPDAIAALDEEAGQ